MSTTSINAQTTRKFLGKTDNFTDKAERLHEGKHLKAYLNGAKRFKSYVWSKARQMFVITYFLVLEELNGKKMDNSIYCETLLKIQKES